MAWFRVRKVKQRMTYQDDADTIACLLPQEIFYFFADFNAIHGWGVWVKGWEDGCECFERSEAPWIIRFGYLCIQEILWWQFISNFHDDDIWMQLPQFISFLLSCSNLSIPLTNWWILLVVDLPTLNHANLKCLKKKSPKTWRLGPQTWRFTKYLSNKSKKGRIFLS